MKTVSSLIEKTNMLKNRKLHREEDMFQEVLMALANKFLLYRLNNEDLEAVQNKFDELNRTWKQYVSNWNGNPKRVTELRNGDFLNLIQHKLKE